MNADRLKRRLGPVLLTGYGVGVMVGAGIYVLVGGVAAQAGVWAPLSFVLAGLIALPAALSYGELSSRLPEAAGEAAYVSEGLGSRALGMAVGLAIVVAGVISAAALLRGGAGYLVMLIHAPHSAVILGLGVFLTGVALIGVLESVGLVVVLTLIEVLGLALVIWAGFSAAPSADFLVPAPPHFPGIAAAAALAFFAFIGFEDMVNMAEEMRDPIHDMPRAILAALAITTLFYLAVSLAAVRAVPLAQLGASEQPLALVWKTAGKAPALLAAIAVAAALNGVLAQVVMAARVLFGLGRRSPALALFQHTHPRFGTPVLATGLVGVVMIAVALSLPVHLLAGATSLTLLAVFVLVNLSLVALKRKDARAPFLVPVWVPVFGALVAGAALLAALGGYA